MPKTKRNAQSPNDRWEQFLAAYRSGSGALPDAEGLADAIYYAAVMLEAPAGGESSESESSGGTPTNPLAGKSPLPKWDQGPPGDESVPLDDLPNVGTQSDLETDAERDVLLPSAPLPGAGRATQGRPVRVPGVEALPEPLKFLQALWPLRKARHSAQAEPVLDLEATAERMADHGGRVWAPVHQRGQERGVSLHVVVEATPPLRIFEPQVEDFVRVARRSGAFATVTTWELQIPPDAELEPTRWRARSRRGSRVADPTRFVFGSRDGVLFLSDCLSRSWRNGRLPGLLNAWARRASVALVPILPRSQWHRTQLRSGTVTPVTNRAYLPTGRELGGSAGTRSDWLPLPLVALHDVDLADWARFMAGQSRGTLTAYTPRPESFQIPPEPLPARGPLSEGQLTERLERFQRSESPGAQRLAVLLAACPLILPVIRLVQSRLAPRTGLSELIELFLSGLVYRPEGEDPLGPPDRICYEFLRVAEGTELRERLLDDLRRSEAVDVLQELSRYLSETGDETVIDFLAIVKDPDARSHFEIPEHNRPFARVGAAVLRRLGREYEDVANLLSEQGGEAPRPRGPRRRAVVAADTLERFEALRSLAERLQHPQGGGYLVASWYPGHEKSLERFLTDWVTWLRPEDSGLLMGSFAGEELEQALAGLEIDSDRPLGVLTFGTGMPVSSGGLGRVVLGSPLENWESLVAETEALLRSGLANRRGDPVVTLGDLVDALGERVQVVAPIATQLPLARNPRYFKTSIHEIELLRVSKGTFMMGSPEDEPGRYDDEGPLHEVTLTEDFYLGKYAVTQGQYRALTGESPSAFTNAGDRAPVEQVSWDDAVAFCRALNSLSPADGGPPADWHFALPSEAQWEYACRGGSAQSTALYTGPITIKGKCHAPELDPIAWYGGNSGVDYEGGVASGDWPGRQYAQDRSGTHPVGEKMANEWGFYDMLGNVWEWCADRFDAQYFGESPDTDPLGPPEGSKRVVRGGSWINLARYCRSACRFGNDPENRDDNQGFRVSLQAGNAEGIWAPAGGAGPTSRGKRSKRSGRR